MFEIFLAKPPHKITPHRRCGPAAGFSPPQAPFLIKPEPYPGDHIRRISDEPGIDVVVGGAGLAGRCHGKTLGRLAGTILDDALHDVGNLVGGTGVDDRCRVRRVRCLLHHLAVSVQDALDEHRAHHAATVAEYRVSRGHLHQ